MAANGLCLGQSPPTPQAAGTPGGVVSLQAGKRPPETHNMAAQDA